jgi:hypothetical protein
MEHQRQNANSPSNATVSSAGNGAWSQRPCACRGAASSLSGQCSSCISEKFFQAKFNHTASDDPFEREADRVAEHALAGSVHSLAGEPTLRIQRYTGHRAGQPDSIPASVDGVLAGAGKPLSASLRNDMERRFGHDFSNVRIFAGAGAERSAADLSAQAYTVGERIVFGAGRFAPETREGRRLLAHELTHVVQQTSTRGAGQTNGLRQATGVSSELSIQRQPDEKPAKEEQREKPAVRKTLKNEGVDLNDPVAGGTAAIIDRVLARNARLAPFIGDSLKAGFTIAEKGKFVQASTDGNFDDAFREAYGLSSSDSVPKHTLGFLDSKKSIIHLRPGANFGTALHEAVHRLASPTLYRVYLPKANKISSELTEVLKEGLTAFFTDLILKEEGLPNFNDAYRSKKKKAEALIAALGTDGFDLIATLNFKGTGIIEIGEKLGFTRNQFSGSRGRGIEEVLTRMAKLL